MAKRFKKGVKGALGGAAAGAAAGSFLPVIGPAIGAGLGALAGGITGLSDKKNKIGNAAFGTPEEVQQHSNITPEQQNILQYLQQMGIQGLQNPYGGFAPIAQQAQNDFYQNTVPSLAERFTSMGNGSLSSPAFASQLGQAGANLQTDLAAQQSQYGQQNIGQILQMLQMALNPQFENIMRPAQSGFVPNFINYGVQRKLNQLIQ
jgi:hypothetical protein